MVHPASVAGTAAGLGLRDALHVAAAIQLDSDEHITTDRPGSPLLQERRLPIRPIRPSPSRPTT